MFGLGRKKKPNLFIKITDVIEIIREDYENGVAFCLIDFQYHNEMHSMGSCVFPEGAVETKKNIRFVFDDEVYETIDQMISSAEIEKIPVSDLPEPIEVTRAGILNGEVLLKSPWGDKRLAAHALNEE